MIETKWLGEDWEYQRALDIQNQRIDEILAGDAPNALFLLEHQPVYTIGRLRDQSSLRDSSHLPFPVFEISRGGQATYHGPGQLTGYLIVDLRERNRDLHQHLRWIEESLVAACLRVGIHAATRENLTGVWIGTEKLASIGVGVRKWISWHGFALNVTAASLPPFDAITPCGLDGVRMTCLAEHGYQGSVEDFSRLCAEELQKRA